MPSVARARTVRTNLLGVGGTKFQAPLVDGFVANHNNAALGHHLFGVAKTQAERNEAQYSSPHQIMMAAS